VLGYSSDVLAQQFTLIEKDALAEVDWQELVEVKWTENANDPVRDWMVFLSERESYGVEFVIARFNLVWFLKVGDIILTM
jgi:hypothetical protein